MWATSPSARGMTSLTATASSLDRRTPSTRLECPRLGRSSNILGVLGDHPGPNRVATQRSPNLAASSLWGTWLRTSLHLSNSTPRTMQTDEVTYLYRRACIDRTIQQSITKEARAMDHPVSSRDRIGRPDQYILVLRSFRTSQRRAPVKTTSPFVRGRIDVPTRLTPFAGEVTQDEPRDSNCRIDGFYNLTLSGCRLPTTEHSAVPQAVSPVRRSFSLPNRRGSSASSSSSS